MPSFAHEQAEGGGKRDFIGTAGADDGIGADAHFGHAIEIFGDPEHFGGAKGFDASVFDGVPDVACQAGLGLVDAVDFGVVMKAAQGEAVGPAADFGDLFGRQGAAGLRHARLIAEAARLVGGIGHFDAGGVAHGAHRRGDGLPEVFERVFGLVHGGVSGAPLPRWIRAVPHQRRVGNIQRRYRVLPRRIC